MDTVEGKKGEKVLLTIHFVKAEFMLAFLRDYNDSKSVTDIFNDIDRLIGREGTVIVPLNGIEGKGQVKIDGQVWSAKADADIAESIRVTVKAIEGVKLVVEIAS